MRGGSLNHWTIWELMVAPRISSYFIGNGEENNGGDNDDNDK